MSDAECIYVPILKCKRGEHYALSDMQSKIKDKIVPVFEIVPPDYDFDNNILKKSIDGQLEQSIGYIKKCWDNGKQFFVDMKFIDNPPLLPNNTKLIKGKFKMANGANPLLFGFDELVSKGLNPVPVIGLYSSKDYINSVKSINNKYGCGLGLRLLAVDYENGAFANNIGNMLADLSVTPGEIDLIIDLGDFRGIQPGLMAQLIELLIKRTPNLNKWRSLIVAGTSIPVDLTEIPIGEQFLPRTEWIVYNFLVKNKRFKRTPVFSDYGINHPDLTVLDARSINISASIRYTIKENFVIHRGRGMRSRGSGGSQQYRSHCSRIISQVYYAGKNFCAGDKYIYECAHGTVGTGNPEMWRRQGTNHHITFVVDQLSKLGVP